MMVEVRMIGLVIIGVWEKRPFACAHPEERKDFTWWNKYLMGTWSQPPRLPCLSTRVNWSFVIGQTTSQLIITQKWAQSVGPKLPD